MTTEIVEYSKTEAALSDLRQKYSGVIFDVTSMEGMNTARKARAEVRKYRTSLEELRIAIKAPALRRCQVIDTEARRITLELLTLEKPIDAQIVNEERRKESERQAAVRAEQERLAAEERARKEAEEKKMAEERAVIEAESKRVAKEKAEFEEQKRQAQLRLEAQEREARRKIEEEERQARLVREEADRKARAVIEERERVSREAQAKEDTRIKAERDALEAERRVAEERQRKERAEQEAKERAVREAKEAKLREIRRKEAEQADARAMLLLFKQRYSHLKQYVGVIKAIDDALQTKEIV